MLWLLSRIIYAGYVAAPILAAIIAARRASRAGHSHLAHSLASFLLTCVTAAIIGTAVVLGHARAAGSHASFGQMALTCYLLAGVLSVLKGLNWILKQATDRLFLLVGRWRRTGPTWEGRMIAAVSVRAFLLAALGLPYMIGFLLVYRPRIISPLNPTQRLGFPFEHASFNASDAEPLDAWWIPALWTGRPEAPPAGEWGTRTVILCHGLGADKSTQLMLIRDLVPRGYNVLSFDFRAHGASGGHFCSFGDIERQDVLGAVRWARSLHPGQSRTIFGLGMDTGGAALIAAAADPGSDGQAIAAVAVCDTYDDLGDWLGQMSRQYFIPPLPWLLTHIAVPMASAHAGVDLSEFRPAKQIDQIAPRPVLIIHARNDSIFDFARGTRLFDAASQPKLRCWIGKFSIKKRSWVDSDDIPADHNGVILSNETSGAVQSFFAWARTVL